MFKNAIFTKKEYYPGNLKPELQSELEQNYQSLLEEASKIYGANTLKIMAQDYTVEVDESIKLEELEAKLAEHQLMTVFDAPSKYSIGEILSENYSSEAAKSCLGLSLIDCHKKASKTGGQVIKNVSGYDLSKIYIGSFNSFAFIKKCFLRVYPRPSHCIELEHTIEINDLRRTLKRLNLSDYDRNTNLSLQANQDEIAQDQINIKLKLWGDEASLDKRKDKMLSRLSPKALIHEKKFTREFMDSEASFGLKVLPGNNLETFSVIKPMLLQLKQFEIEIKPKYGEINLYIDDFNPASSEAHHFLTQIASKSNAMLKLFPVNLFNRRVERELNFPQENQEITLLQALKKQFDPEDILNPGVYYE